METLKGLEIIAFKDSAQLEAWLAGHYQLQSGVWLKIAKKDSGIASVTNDEANDLALVVGLKRADGVREH